MGSGSNGTRGAFLSVVSEVYCIILILRTKFYSILHLRVAMAKDIKK